MKSEIFIQNGENEIPYKIFNNDSAFFKSSLGFPMDLEEQDYHIIVSKMIEFPLTIVFFELFPVNIEKEIVNIPNYNHHTMIRIYSIEEWDFIFQQLYMNLINGVEVALFHFVNTSDWTPLNSFLTTQFTEEIEYPHINEEEVMTYISLSIHGMFVQTRDRELDSLEKIFFRLKDCIRLDEFNSDLWKENPYIIEFTKKRMEKI